MTDPNWKTDVWVLSVVGFHNAGKSTFIESLVRTIRSDGFRVGVIKHDGHQDESVDDHSNPWETNHSDTVRAANAGADWTMVASTRGWLVHAWHDRTSSDDWIDTLLANAEQRGQHIDVVVVEGGKRTRLPKVAVVRGQDDVDALKEMGVMNLVAVCLSDISGDFGTRPVRPDTASTPVVSGLNSALVWQVFKDFFEHQNSHKNF